MNTRFGNENKKSTVSDVVQIDRRLLEKLRCPACTEGTFQEICQEMVKCRACKRSFPVIDGIPNLSYFPESREEATVFDNLQARYECQIHDRAAQDTYEELVIGRYGDKTEAIATGWAKTFPGPFLDFGCGTGQICRCLKKVHAEVYGFDISPISVEQNVHDNDVFGVVANAFCVPFRSRAFETVCCNGVLHHIINLKSAIDEMARVSNKYILISETCVDSYHPIWLKFKLLLIKTLKLLLKFFGLLDISKQMLGTSHGSRVGSKYERCLDPKDIVELLKQAGFSANRLRFWTNIGWNRRSRLKKLLIRMMVSRRRGTHFEIHAERERD